MNTRLLFGFALLWQFLAPSPHARGQVYEKVYDFREGQQAAFSNKGAHPTASLVQGRDGNFYGTTFKGGAYGFGTIFKMTRSGELTTLVEFTGYDSGKAFQNQVNIGAFPAAELVLGGDGNFYGTTAGGTFGTSDSGVGDNEVFGGTIFRMTPEGQLTTLWFSGTNERFVSPLMLASDGNFYGTSYGNDDADNGAIFKITPAGDYTVLVEGFTGDVGPKLGRRLSAGLVEGNDGNLYGSTAEGGTY